MAKKKAKRRAKAAKVTKVTKVDPMRPEPVLLMKLGSALVHAQEALEPGGNALDRAEFLRAMQDSDVVAWIEGMGVMLPLKRSHREAL